MITEKTIEAVNETATRTLGEKIGRLLKGCEVIELVGDVGAGKTTFVKGLATGLAIEETVQSPTFTISRIYDARNGLLLAHYDFYRLNDAGIMADELAETTKDPASITVIEWANIVEGVLPDDRLRITFTAPTETTRLLQIAGTLPMMDKL